MRDATRVREATPRDVSLTGVLKRSWDNFANDRILAVAAGSAFYILLAIFPAMAAVVSLYALFADPTKIESHLTALSGIAPGGAMQVIGDELKRITAQAGPRLGVAFMVGLAVSVWSANAGVKAMFDALNVAYEEEEERSFIRLNATSLAFTALALLFAAAAIGLLIALPALLDRAGLGAAKDTIVEILRWPALIVTSLLGLALLYRYGPARTRPKWRWITWGSALATALWMVMSAAFTWYAAHFGNYDKVYGSLGAIVGFMTWIWLSATIVLIGAQFDHEMELRDTAREADASGTTA